MSMKFQVNFVDKDGKLVHRLQVEAKDKTDVCFQIAKDPEIRQELQKAVKGRGGEVDFYIYPAKDLN